MLGSFQGPVVTNPSPQLCANRGEKPSPNEKLVVFAKRDGGRFLSRSSMTRVAVKRRGQAACSRELASAKSELDPVEEPSCESRSQRRTDSPSANGARLR